MSNEDGAMGLSSEGMVSRRTIVSTILGVALTSVLAQEASAEPIARPGPASGRANNMPPANSVAPLPRLQHTATALLDGRVLVAGGMLFKAAASPSVQIYDPLGDTWSDAAGMKSPRFQHAAALLADGRVMVSGGFFANNTALTSVEIYDPRTDTWEQAAGMSMPRYGHALTVLPSGQVLVTGGAHHSPITSTDLYDPFAGQWASARVQANSL